MPLSIQWTAPSSDLAIHSGVVHVWAWESDCSQKALHRYVQLLSEAEKAQIQRLHFGRDRTWRTICYARRRIILAKYLCIPAVSIAFDKSSGGRPSLTAEANTVALDFNLSHADCVALMAIAIDLRVGIDIEAVRPIDTEIARSCFSEMKQQSVSRLTEGERLSQFYKLWTQKEAVLKAEGVGLGADITALDHEPQDHLAIGAHESRQVPGITQPWNLQELYPAPGYIGAIATSRTPRHIAYYRFID